MDKVIDNQYHQWHESIEEMNAWCDKAIGRHHLNRIAFDRTVLNRQERGWFGFGCWQASDVLQRLEYGWPEYEAAVSAASEKLEAHLTLDTTVAMTMEVRKRKRRWMEQGDTLDIHRVWGGELDRAWQRPVRFPKLSPTQRYATIFIDIGTLASRAPDEGVWRAALAMRVCDLLTSMGIATEIWCGASSLETYERGFGSQAWFATRVKEYTQPINLNRVAGLSSVGAHRTVGFKMKCAGPGTIADNFGVSFEQGFPLPLRERQQAGERVFRIGNCWNMEDAVRQMAQVAKDLAPTTSASEQA